MGGGGELEFLDGEGIGIFRWRRCKSRGVWSPSYMMSLLREGELRIPVLGPSG